MYYQPKIDFQPSEVVVYLRKSQSDDPVLTVEEVLARHEAILDEWTASHLGGIVPEENKYREVVSGETLKNRPEVNKMLRRIENPKIKAVVVVEPQRLTRGDLEDIGRIMKLLKHTNTLILTPTRIYDLHDEYDFDAFERELKRGNDYLEYTKKILNRGRLLSVSQGNFIASIAPYGYNKVFVTDGKRKVPTLEENKEQADVVRMIFDLYVNADMGYHRICARLDSLGIQPPKGKNWSPAALKDMLTNVHYIGKVKWNWRKTVTIVSDSEIIETRPKAKEGEYLIYEGRHKGIVPPELFQAAQEKQGRNTREVPFKSLRNPLAGLVYCQCGRCMSLHRYMKNGEERTPARYLCDNQTICGTSSCTYDEMVQKVSEILQQSIHDFEVALKNDDGSLLRTHQDNIKRLEAKKADLDKKEISLWEAQTDPDQARRMPDHVFRAITEKVVKEREEVQASLRTAYETMPERIDYEEKILRFQTALDALHNDTIPAAQKNTLLKSCIVKIHYSREKSERMKSTAKRIRIDGRSIRPNGLPVGGNWTSPDISLDITLKV